MLSWEKMKCNSNVLIDFQSGNYICISYLGCVLLLLLLSFCKVCVCGGAYIYLHSGPCIWRLEFKVGYVRQSLSTSLP